MHLDGFLSYPSAVYTVPYGVMVPKEVGNLLLPVPGVGFAHRIFHPAHGALLDGNGTGRWYRLRPFD